MKYALIGIGIVAVVITALVVFSDGDSPDIQAVTWPSGSITSEGPMFHDWGNINIKGGDVEHVFTLKNDSSNPLQIKTASTSCMCTSVYIDVGSTTSPTFGMHNNPSNWGQIVDPGETFSVRMVFDPMAHGPNAVGPIQRSAYIETSAIPDGKVTTVDTSTEGSILELRTAGNVMYEDEYNKAASESPYKYAFGDFHFKENEFDFGVVKQSAGIQTHNFEFQYTGSGAVIITGTPTSCACTTAAVSVSELSNGDTGILTVEFDPNLHEEPLGKFFKTISILTERGQDPAPEVKIWAEIDLDLGAEAYKLKDHAD